MQACLWKEGTYLLTCFPPRMLGWMCFITWWFLLKEPGFTQTVVCLSQTFLLGLEYACQSIKPILMRDVTWTSLHLGVVSHTSILTCLELLYYPRARPSRLPQPFFLAWALFLSQQSLPFGRGCYVLAESGVNMLKLCCTHKTELTIKRLFFWNCVVFKYWL